MIKAVTWDWPTVNHVGYILNGDFYTYHKMDYSVVRDRCKGFNVCRVDWESGVPNEERERYMNVMRDAAEIKYQQKAIDGNTL